MSIKNAGRRGLFGLLAGAPVAAIACAAESKGVTVNVFAGSGAKAVLCREGQDISVIVEAVERKMSERLSRGQGSLGKTLEASYDLQRAGR